MNRYCVNCDKEFDFSPLEVSGRNDLICPECGQIIDKNSRRPKSNDESDKIENTIAGVFAQLLHMSYIFYLLCACAGVVGFFLKIDALLFLATAIALAAFFVQLFTGTLIFTSGLIFLPIGAVCGYLIVKNIRGAFLGINVVFVIRHIIRDIFYRLIGWFIGFINR